MYVAIQRVLSLFSSFALVRSAAGRDIEQDGAMVDASDALRHGMFESGSLVKQYVGAHPAYFLDSMPLSRQVIAWCWVGFRRDRRGPLYVLWVLFRSNVTVLML